LDIEEELTARLSGVRWPIESVQKVQDIVVVELPYLNYRVGGDRARLIDRCSTRDHEAAALQRRVGSGLIDLESHLFVKTLGNFV
jgi:hypothetical protein